MQVALELLPFDRRAPVRALDLGIGTGYFAAQFLNEFPSGTVVGVDVAQAMLDLAATRLGDCADRAELRLGDVRALDDDLGTFDAMLSSYTFHHLDRAEKVAVVRAGLALLRPGGWLLNADLVVSEHPSVEQRIQELRVEGIVRRAAGRDERFADAEATRRFLDDVGRRDADRPLTLAEDLDVMCEAGLCEAAVYWLEYREAVWGGRRTDA